MQTRPYILQTRMSIKERQRMLVGQLKVLLQRVRTLANKSESYFLWSCSNWGMSIGFFDCRINQSRSNPIEWLNFDWQLRKLASFWVSKTYFFAVVLHLLNTQEKSTNELCSFSRYHHDFFSLFWSFSIGALHASKRGPLAPALRLVICGRL